MADLHVIYRREPGLAEQWSVYSFPVSVYTGGSTLAEARAKFREAAEFGVDALDQYNLIEHIEQPLDEHSFVRAAVDRYSLDRQETARQFAGTITVAAQAAAFRQTAPRTASGDAVVVAGVASDTVRWVLDQMGEHDALSVCLALPGGMVWWTYLAQQHAELPAANPTESLADAGIQLDATLSEFMRADSVKPSPPRTTDGHEGDDYDELGDNVEYRPGLLVAQH